MKPRIGPNASLGGVSALVHHSTVIKGFVYDS
jgi:hypothetical protein